MANNHQNLMGKILLLVGNFAVGKTSIIKGEGYKKGLFFHLNDGKKIFGGPRGADDIKIKKNEAFEILRKEPGDILIAGFVYSHKIDILRYKQSHELKVVFLETSKKENKKRALKRGGKFNEKNWAKMTNKIINLKKYCLKMGVDFVEVDNNRDLEDVKRDVFNFFGI